MTGSCSRALEIGTAQPIPLEQRFHTPSFAEWLAFLANDGPSGGRAAVKTFVEFEQNEHQLLDCGQVAASSEKAAGLPGADAEAYFQ